ncbi:MAG TPA: alpha/beta hydrolase [Myxococcaceae bacterium]|nr:alpha/beta hydrolase [Myxococcaceae bacterium]
MVAVLHASVGDRLHAAGLAAEMRIIQGGRPVDPSPAALRKAFPRARRCIAVWMHGLGVTETVWTFRGARRTSYGTMLEKDAGFTPVFLRYNTGRSIQENGAAADALLDRLEASWPVRPREIALIGYSMGGLVARSALQHGIARSAPWVRLVRHTVHLGVPHLGSPVERAGRVATSLLKSLPNPWTKLVGRAADLRSAGVKDLAGGDLVPDGAWVPLPLEGMHHAIIGTLHPDPQHVLSWLLGDGVVPIASARAQRYGDAEVFSPERITIVGGIGHLGLPRSARVYPAILGALAGRRRRAHSPARPRASTASGSGRRGTVRKP